MSTSDYAIVVRDLKKTLRVGFWGRRVELLRGVSFDVASGAIFGFVGPNGAGKSTTIKTLIGASRASSGAVEVLGASPGDLEVRRRLGYLPEVANLPASLTPRELLWLHARLAGLDTDTASRRISALLERVELEGRERDRVGSFSKGMQQRVALALALLGEPDLLIFDEPMSGLDPVGRRLMREVLREQRARGCTVFFSSHILPDVEALCDEVALLVRGEVLRRGSLSDVLVADVHGYELLFRAPDDAPPELGALGAAQRRGGVWVLHVEKQPVRAAAELEQRGCEVISLEPMHPSLEDQLVALIDGEREEARA